MRTIRAGATSQTIYVEVLDSTSTTGGRKTGLAFNTSSLTAYYVLNGGSATAITLATLAAANSAWSSGGFKEVDATNMPGIYRLDVPDAAVASGPSVVVTLKGATGMVQVSMDIQLVAWNPQDTVRGGLTALPNVASGSAGAIITSGTGTAQLNVSGGIGDANVKQLLGTAWLTPGTAGTPDVNVKLWNGLTTVALPLVPTTAGRTLDVSTGGEAGLDWANIGSPTTTVALTGTTIATTQKVDIETIKTNPVVNAGTITFPTTATLASTTNITAGTVTTATNVTTVSSGAISEASYATTAGAFAPLRIVDRGTAQSATGTTLVLRSAAAFADSELVGATIVIRTATTGAGQSRVITAYVGATDTATVDTWTTTPTGTITYDIFGTAPVSATSTPVNVTQWNGTAVATPATAGIPEVNIKNINNVATATPGAAGGLFIAGTNAATTITTSLTTTFTGNLTGSVGSVTGSVGSVTGAVGSVTGAVGSVTGNVGGNVAGNVTGSVGSVATGGIAAASFASNAITATALATSAVDEVVDGVWDELIAGHLGAGSTGAALNAAGSAGDPWTTPLPGAYGAGTAGFIIGTNLDVPVSNVETDTQNIQTRLPAALVSGRMDSNTQATAATLTFGLTGNITGNLSGSVGSVTGAVGSVTGSVGSVTGNVGGNVVGSTASVTGAVGSVTGNVGGNVSGNVSGNVVGSVGSVTGSTGSIVNTDAVADAVLNRDFAAVADTNSRTLLNSARFLRNKWTVSGSTLTVCEENDVTTAWTAAIATDAAAIPIVGSDPT